MAQEVVTIENLQEFKNKFEGNLKTINGNSIVGEGNIEIQGGGSTYTSGEGINVDNTNNTISLNDNAKQKLEDIDNAKNLTFSNGITSTTSTTSIDVGLDNPYILDICRSLFGVITIEPEVTYWDMFENIGSFEAHSWYDLTYFNTNNVIIFNEDATTPSGTVNFRNKFIPSIKVNFSKPLDLVMFPMMLFYGFSINSAPFEFRLIDTNGNKSSEIVIGKLDKGTFAQNAIKVDCSTYQSVTAKKISSLNNAGYTSYTGTTQAAVLSNVNNYVATEPNLTKCYTIEVDMLEDLETPIVFDEGFDKSNISGIEIQCVEWSDKTSVSWKERHKAFVPVVMKFEKKV